MRSCAKPKVFCQDSPSAFTVKRCDPFLVRGLIAELVSKGNYLVVIKKSLERPSELRAKIVVQQELQAVSFSWNAIASRTAETLTSYSRATLSARTSVGMPPMLEIGRPKARAH